MQMKTFEEDRGIVVVTNSGSFFSSCLFCGKIITRSALKHIIGKTIPNDEKRTRIAFLEVRKKGPGVLFLRPGAYIKPAHQHASQWAGSFWIDDPGD